MTLKSLTTYNHLFLNFEHLSNLSLFAIKKGWGIGAATEDRTRDLLHGKQTHYRCATAANCQP